MTIQSDKAKRGKDEVYNRQDKDKMKGSRSEAKRIADEVSEERTKLAKRRGSRQREEEAGKEKRKRAKRRGSRPREEEAGKKKRRREKKTKRR